jgi:hypothetical protein
VDVPWMVMKVVSMAALGRPGDETRASGGNKSSPAVVLVCRI